MTLFFVTPAHRRYELSAVCFEQRRRVIETLAEHGVEARCVVVADDENLDIARSMGFDTVEQSNEWLGRKFNDGMEYAGRHGATHIAPIGSDSWIDPAYFLPYPKPGVIRTASAYCPVTNDKLAELNYSYSKGCGPYTFPREALEPSGFRPATDEINRSVDTSTLASIPDMEWQHHEVHPFQYIGFRGTPHLTPYEKLVAKWGVQEYGSPWEILAKHYPADLVARAQAALRADQRVAA